METWLRIGLSALVTGTAASVASAGALALLAKREGKGALQPTNATSHWLHGDAAARHRAPDVAHTLLGYATHHASAVFWAVPFEAWLAARPPRSPVELLRDAFAMSAIAAAVDYGATPKRLTPGWELVVSKRSMAAAYGAMALGLAAGALVARAWLGDDRSGAVRRDHAGDAADRDGAAEFERSGRDAGSTSIAPAPPREILTN
jgi:hypothetical protein